jgi:hypothetical protein
MKKRIIVLTAVALLLTFTVGVTASAGLLRASQYLSSYSAWATANGNGSVTFSFDVTATMTSDQVGVSQIEVQRKDGSTWTSVYTYNSSNTTGLILTNCTSYIASITYNGTSGHDYRAIVTFYVQRNGGSDSGTRTTNSVTA